MSSWKNASKAGARSYKERSQPASRSHLGALEKKKDYKQRAIDHQRKQNTLKVLTQKALARNPDEFYFNMVKTVKKDGVHQSKQDTEVYTPDQKKLMFSQDQRYVNMKRSSELKKIERLKSSLHLIDAADQPQNKHTVFVASKKEARNFDAAKHFGTHPALVGRRFNRPTMESLQGGEFADIDESALQTATEKKKRKYQELKKRIEREKHLGIISQKMERKKQLLQDKAVKKKKVAAETKEAAAQYKWQFKRKR
ncbi:probable U3 small nucleolar RNA-associated protein 11 [Mercenaria mercenaria]|uniref:probable U3 small nucleolar RNA-associated protein 11 n=1 Tax=Mercenaria mercenaria TaxID=6596 RepID=UPI00234EAB99|nr:probable U3 small nucleolar RNA-associated protein 11 [Mercenaria mercenaria]